MMIKKINFKDYKKLKNFAKKNISNWDVPNYNNWKSIWDQYPESKIKSPCGDILISKKKIVGYQTYFQKIILYKNKEFKVNVHSNWLVKKKYRSKSLSLINKYFKDKADIYLTSTGSKEASQIWKIFGAHEVNAINCKKVYYKIFKINSFIRSYLRWKNINFIPNFFTNLFSIILQVIFFKKFYITKEKNLFSTKNCLIKNLAEIEKFNLIYEKQLIYPTEKRSNKHLDWYLNIIKYNKKIKIIKILYKKNIIGYFVLALTKNSKLKLKTIYLAEIRIFKKYNKFLKNILLEIEGYSKKTGYDVLEYRNLNNFYKKYFNFNNYFQRTMDHNSYMLKFSSTINLSDKRKFLNNFHTSYLDGDNLL